MKFFNSILLLLLLSTSFSCKKFITDDLNTNPNAPLDVPINAQLPSIEISLVDLSGGIFSRRCGMLVQQVEGVARGCISINQYFGLTADRSNTPWTIIYGQVLNEINIAKAKANEKDYFHYKGVLNILEAYALMTSSDLWDDIPYTNQLNNSEENNPSYIKQSEIYDVIYQLLDEAIVLIEGPVGSLTPSSDDVLNEGNTDLWIKAAHGIKARGLLHQKEYADAKEEAMLSFTNLDENLSYQYPDANNAANWYRFNRDRTGDIEFHPTMRNLMTSLNDSVRLAAIDQTFDTDHSYFKANYSEDLISFREVQFIIAETDVRLNPGNAQLGHDAYLKGVKASFDRFGIEDDSDYENYISQITIDPGIANLTLEEVMTQKYIGLFVQSEAYNDWRRTGIPDLSPVSGPNVPVRWHYPADEYQFNSNAPNQSSIDIYTNKVGWNR